MFFHTPPCNRCCWRSSWWWSIGWQSWTCINSTPSDRVPWGLKNNLCVAGCGFCRKLKAILRQQISHFTLATLKSHTSKASFIYLFIRRERTEKTTPQRFLKHLLSGLCCVALLLFTSSLWVCHILPYQLFGETLFLMSVNMEDALLATCSFLFLASLLVFAKLRL